MWYLCFKKIHFFYIFQFFGVQVFVVWLNDSLDFLSICYVFLFTSGFVNLDVFFLCLLLSLNKGLPLLLIFSKNQFFVSLILCIVFFVSISLISAHNLIISCLLLLLDQSASFCSKSFRCAVKLLV